MLVSEDVEVLNSRSGEKSSVPPTDMQLQSCGDGLGLDGLFVCVEPCSGVSVETYGVDLGDGSKGKIR